MTLTEVSAVLVSFGGGSFFFHKWINRVDDTLKLVTNSLHEHLLAEEAFRGDFKLIEEHIKISNGINKKILDEIQHINEEQTRVKVELARREEPWNSKKV